MGKPCLTRCVYPLLYTALLFILFIGIAYLSSVAVFEIDLESDMDSSIQLFWTEISDDFNERNSNAQAIQTGRHHYRFFIPRFTKRSRLRMDFHPDSGKIKLYQLQTYTLFSGIIGHPIAWMRNLNDITLQAGNDHSDVYSTAIHTSGADPYFEIPVIAHRYNAIRYAFMVFILISGLVVCHKKKNRHSLEPAMTALLALVLTYSILVIKNEVTAKITIQSSSPGLLMAYWKNSVQQFSSTRAQIIHFDSGTHQYPIKTSNAYNIDEISIVAQNPSEQLTVEEISAHEPGFNIHGYPASTAGNCSQTRPENERNSCFYTIELKKTPDLGSLLISVLSTILYVLIIAYTLYKASHNTCWQRLLARTLFFLATAMIFMSAWHSEYNIHPDESAHAESVKYYTLYWDPPTVGDPRAEKAYQYPWAVSRLDNLGVSYFFAGKFMNWMQNLIQNDVFTARSFNGLLFVILFALSRQRKFLLFCLPLLCTPQIWYLFSYTNRGAFALFISVLLAWQIANQNSSLHKFLHSETLLKNWQFLILPSVLIGILSIEQSNYFIFILFLCAVLLWELFFDCKNKRIFIYKCSIFIILGISFFAIRYGIDVAINGFNKYEQQVAYAETHAAPDFRPSVATTEQSYLGLRLQQKGVRLSELFAPGKDWHTVTFKSFVGFYGYYAEQSPRWYYIQFALILSVAIACIIIFGIKINTMKLHALTIITSAFILGGILLSVLFSWLYDFQPQGRYTFPVIPIFLVYIWKVYPYFKIKEKALIKACFIYSTLLSFYSFNEVALNYTSH